MTEHSQKQPLRQQSNSSVPDEQATKSSAIPLVSIGLPVYNGMPFLTEALDSLLAQTFQNFELIISDNASTDSTAEILADYAQKDPRVRLFRQPQNIGAGMNFSFVLDQARAEYFMFAAHDDIWEPSFIESSYRLLATSSSAVLAFSCFDAINYQGQTIPGLTVRWLDILRQEKCDQFRQLLSLSFINSDKACFFFGLMRRSFLTKCFAKASKINFYDGFDFCTILMLLDRGEIVMADELLFHYRHHPYLCCQEESLIRFLRRRLFGASDRRQWNVFEFIQHTHNLFANQREVVMKLESINNLQRTSLYWLVVLLEIREYLVEFPRRTLVALSSWQRRR